MLNVEFPTAPLQRVYNTMFVTIVLLVIMWVKRIALTTKKCPVPAALVTVAVECAAVVASMRISLVTDFLMTTARYEQELLKEKCKATCQRENKICWNAQRAVYQTKWTRAASLNWHIPEEKLWAWSLVIHLIPNGFSLRSLQESLSHINLQTKQSMMTTLDFNINLVL